MKKHKTKRPPPCGGYGEYATTHDRYSGVSGTPETLDHALMQSMTKGKKRTKKSKRPPRPTPADKIRITGVIPEPVAKAHFEYRAASLKAGLPHGPFSLYFLKNAREGLMLDAFVMANRLVEVVRTSTALISELRRYHDDGYRPATRREHEHSADNPQVEERMATVKVAAPLPDGMWYDCTKRSAKRQDAKEPKQVIWWCTSCDKAPRLVKLKDHGVLCCTKCGKPLTSRPQATRVIS